jgi:hypothetical protein
MCKCCGQVHPFTIIKLLFLYHRLYERPRADRIRAATVRADSSTTDLTLTFSVEAEAIEVDRRPQVPKTRRKKIAQDEAYRAK